MKGAVRNLSPFKHVNVMKSGIEGGAVVYSKKLDVMLGSCLALNWKKVSKSPFGDN